ncbi:TPA: hypothetical protein N0F65_005267 [Lagenidium giganteum]|uniref:Protein kinase n=1 Tax=Lagenidium giganteum TaxID=4803 RepID=A0AAV2YT53_9STRA|nr:TPA: hypothetical protein N0F65_005267 [Lagenidium giganteum]
MAIGKMIYPEDAEGRMRLNDYFEKQNRGLLIALGIGYGMLAVLSASMVVYMRYNQNEAFRGDASAARKIILPAFRPLLLLLAVFSLLFTVYFIVKLSIKSAPTAITKLETEVYYAGRMFVMVVVIVLMFQKSLSPPALRRASVISLVLSAYTVPLVWYTSRHCSRTVIYWSTALARLVQVILFVWVFINPPARASKRSLREYCLFMFIYYAGLYTYGDLFFRDYVDLGFIVTFCTIIWGSLCPLVIWRVLKADTEHWRGLGRRAVALQSLFRQKNNVHERISSRGLHVLIEMHRKYIIDFAYLELKQRIGVGASAVVFNGILNSKIAVAVKVYTPNELTDDTVAEFSHEAALCGALNHPNVVKFYGMCVCPPTICLVSELCQGSLDDVTRALARRTHDIRRQQFAINLNYMIDAARAVAYLHSFSPAFLHRDIKPANFLVDAHCVVKLTDFGESRSLPRHQQQQQQHSPRSETQQNSGSTAVMRSSATDLWSALQTPALGSEQHRNAMTVRGTADYMAPEIIQGKAGTAMYGEAADIFSLSITLWDIMHPLEEKYPETNNNHLRIFDAVLNSRRPQFGLSDHPTIQHLLTEGWDPRPERRPSAQFFVSTLERLKQEVLGSMAVVLNESIEKKRTYNTRTKNRDECAFSGQMLVQRLLENDFVCSAEEATRMGNALMSAGLMHHHRHVLPFDNSAELYRFDDYVLDAHAQPHLPPPPPLHHRGTACSSLSYPSSDNVSVGSNTQQMPELVRVFRPHTSNSSHGSSTTPAPCDEQRSSTSSASAGPATKSPPPMLEHPACLCRKLGKGMRPAGSKKRRFHRAKKWQPLTEGAVLTEKLLTNEFGNTGDSAFDDFFDTPSTCTRTRTIAEEHVLDAPIMSHPDSDYEDDDGNHGDEDAVDHSYMHDTKHAPARGVDREDPTRLAAARRESTKAIMMEDVVNATVTPIVTTLSPAASAKAAKLISLRSYLHHSYIVLQLFLLLGYGIMCSLCCLLIGYLRYNRNVAFRGDAVAARKIILPAFEPLLWILGGATGMYTIFFATALSLNLYENGVPKVATEFFYSGRQFVFLSVIVFMLQSSVSIPALRRTVFITFLLSTYTIPIIWLAEQYWLENFYYALQFSRAPMLLLYTYVFIRPPSRASKRTLREFCVFAYIYYAGLFAYNELFRETHYVSGFNLTFFNLLWGAMCPLVIWRVLKADTEYWRGMGQRAVALQSLFRQKNNINERISSQGLHVLIEMHRKYIIDFAYLELKQRIGVGASAVVFNGILNSKIAVAVKVYTPSDFTEEIVAEFSHEAALCGALNHPNVVKFHGMCVCPPTICLVSELCQGSLDDVMCALARREPNEHRKQFLISLGYMIDAARAVAYIHSFSPAFLHRDIKPENFLVDAVNTVKLTDFGESRSLPRAMACNAVQLTTPDGASLQQRDVYGAGPSVAAPPMSHRMTVRGTVDYMAPELINGKAGVATYGEAADVYSLAMTMWDILNPGRDKYPTLKNNHLQVFEHVVQGHRPELPESVHPSLRVVIENAWQADARMRPSAMNIVSILESIQEEVYASFAAVLMQELDAAANMNKYGVAVEHTFSGEHFVERLEAMEYVSSVGEAVRLGNGMMDAGLVHHLKHARPFEDTDAIYFFDEDNINLCQPLQSHQPGGIMLLPKYGDDDATETQTATTRRSRRSQVTTADFNRTANGGAKSEQGLYENGVCACRKYGQRLEHVKAPRRRFRRNKFKTISEDNVLTTKLLAEELQQQEFDDFDAVNITVAA